LVCFVTSNEYLFSTLSAISRQLIPLFMIARYTRCRLEQISAHAATHG